MAAIILIIMIILGIIALIGLITLIGNVIGIVLTLLFAGLIGWAADAIIPGNVPFGFIGSILAGLFGSWLGVALFGTIGPTIFRIPVISAFIGAVIISLVFSLLITPLSHRRAA